MNYWKALSWGAVALVLIVTAVVVLTAPSKE
jgi:hypothetical protein